MSFKGKTALITGGGTGIGRSAALALARAGAALVIGNRNSTDGEEVVAQIRAEGGQAVFQQTDVRQPDQVQALVQLAVRTYGGLQLAFNNAGFGGETGRTHEQSLESVSQVLDVNIKGVFYSMKYEIEQMLQGGGGAIVNTSSLGGLRGMHGMSPYSASKHAIIGLSRSAALEYAQDGIRINVVAPGPIETRMLSDATDGNPHAWARMTAMKRIGQPEEVAEAVLWLLSDAASYVTGEVLSVDGGMIAR